ncbi:hypothetical protein C8J57DRAFT_1641109 [Mycena rebaudengoi]|nr:hypothetical protein C8J57DRAFT_1641109 [Mycena rebaudengoi]
MRQNAIPKPTRPRPLLPSVARFWPQTRPQHSKYLYMSRAVPLKLTFWFWLPVLAYALCLTRSRACSHAPCLSQTLHDLGSRHLLLTSHDVPCFVSTMCAVGVALLLPGLPPSLEGSTSSRGSASTRARHLQVGAATSCCHVVRLDGPSDATCQLRPRIVACCITPLFDVDAFPFPLAPPQRLLDFFCIVSASFTFRACAYIHIPWMCGAPRFFSNRLRLLRAACMLVLIVVPCALVLSCVGSHANF